MQLHKLLSITGGACFVLGLGGLAGAVEFGTGWVTSITLLVISVVCIPLAMREDGRFRQKNRPHRRPKHGTCKSTSYENSFACIITWEGTESNEKS